MNIKVDIREQELINQLNGYIAEKGLTNELTVSVETLPIGDILIEKNGEVKLIIERKSVNDLLSSIKDGRYGEQSYRLNGIEHPNHNIMYIIEGDINKVNYFKYRKGICEKQMLYSAIFSLNYYKGFSVIRTFNLNETALFICNSANKLRKGETENKIGFYEKKSPTDVQNTSIEDVGTPSDKDYVNVVKKVKKDNITSENIGEIMLCQIPGISSITSIAVMQKFKNLPNLIENIQTNPDCLNDLTYTNSKGQTRKITKTSITNILNVFLKKDVELLS
jgi:ERCC4-type nuclease